MGLPAVGFHQDCLVNNVNIFGISSFIPVFRNYLYSYQVLVVATLEHIRGEDSNRDSKHHRPKYHNQGRGVKVDDLIHNILDPHQQCWISERFMVVRYD